ncbi:WbqC-like protein family protein [Nonlabens sp. Hel1_33_55]|uniref:WbqC family protein n=1 Tax=Nonlabens sp. Hel1_33_55 TaxID=1336802 RepID=UPI000875EDA7|nr:WbqC family protein [Nonlabens sp. Hel1_33_55]SCY02095.1 WbqC-like protein family protein [Nonlabens sp. Hel1_33_55]
MPLIIHPSYFVDVESLIHIFHYDGLLVDASDSYVKQTYRSRCYIAAANGPLTLNIPIVHNGKVTSMLYKDVPIDNSQPWASNHLKSIASAYKSSPYYEYYEDDLKRLYDHIPDRLMDWNIKTMQWLLSQLEMKDEFAYAEEYLGNNVATYLITAKKLSTQNIDPYMQVFQEKHGFQTPMSGLDLLFNLGPSSRAYLKNVNLS